MVHAEEEELGHLILAGARRVDGRADVDAQGAAGLDADASGEAHAQGAVALGNALAGAPGAVDEVIARARCRGAWAGCRRALLDEGEPAPGPDGTGGGAAALEEHAATDGAGLGAGGVGEVDQLDLGGEVERVVELVQGRGLGGDADLVAALADRGGTAQEAVALG